jgi:PAS domain-containing protein
VLYSVRLPRGPHAGQRRPGRESAGSSVLHNAEIMLVSAASRTILGFQPDELYGPFSAWLQHIEETDRELVIAALGQLSLQKQPVCCEYRLRAKAPPVEESPSVTAMLPHLPRLPRERWLRDTLVPYHDSQGVLAGWEGVIEDITEQRSLAHDRRLTAGIFHSLITNMSIGVFFVQAPHGRLLLINPSARKLLGQREDLAAGLEHLSRVYRLFRPDNTPYPWEELPVSRALRENRICMTSDVVVHRPDGRRITLVSWAAPVDLSNLGQGHGAVWIFEDFNEVLETQSS